MDTDNFLFDSPFDKFDDLFDENGNQKLMAQQDIKDRFPHHWLVPFFEDLSFKVEDESIGYEEGEQLLPFIGRFIVLNQIWHTEAHRFIMNNNNSAIAVFTGKSKTYIDWYNQLDENIKNKIPILSVLTLPVVTEIKPN